MKRCVECRSRYEATGRTFPIDEWLCRDCQRCPAVQVRILLCRARVQGFDFERAWAFALGCEPGDEPEGSEGRVRWPHDTQHRQDWKSVFQDPETVETWEAAYCRLPVREVDRRVQVLAA